MFWSLVNSDVVRQLQERESIQEILLNHVEKPLIFADGMVFVAGLSSSEILINYFFGRINKLKYVLTIEIKLQKFIHIISS